MFLPSTIFHVFLPQKITNKTDELKNLDKVKDFFEHHIRSNWALGALSDAEEIQTFNRNNSLVRKLLYKNTKDINSVGLANYLDSLKENEVIKLGQPKKKRIEVREQYDAQYLFKELMADRLEVFNKTMTHYTNFKMSDLETLNFRVNHLMDLPQPAFAFPALTKKILRTVHFKEYTDMLEQLRNYIAHKNKPMIPFATLTMMDIAKLLKEFDLDQDSDEYKIYERLYINVFLLSNEINVASNTMLYSIDYWLRYFDDVGRQMLFGTMSMYWIKELLAHIPDLDLYVFVPTVGFTKIRGIVGIMEEAYVLSLTKKTDTFDKLTETDFNTLVINKYQQVLTPDGFKVLDPNQRKQKLLLSTGHTTTAIVSETKQQFYFYDMVLDKYSDTPKNPIVEPYSEVVFNLKNHSKYVDPNMDIII